jgi:DNA-binding response OmpR family regulator
VKSAVAALKKWPFDVVVTEWRLFPDGSGLDIVAAIRSRPELERMRIVFLTVARDEKQSIRNTGADAVLFKPVPIPIVVQTLRRVLRRIARRKK